MFGERSTDLTERGSGAGVRRDVEVDAPIGGGCGGDDVADASAGDSCLGYALGG